MAASLCDRYLSHLANNGAKAPCLIKLAIVTTLMSAKLEQPIQPSYNKMIRIVEQKWHVIVDKKDILDLEYDLVWKLDYDLHFAGPIPFLERYLRIFDLESQKS